MPSPKALQYEKDLLNFSARIKTQILTYVHDSEDQQTVTRAVNDFYDRAHRESRHLRKALAFLHTKVEVLEECVQECEVDVGKLYAEKLDETGRRK